MTASSLSQDRHERSRFLACGFARGRDRAGLGVHVRITVRRRADRDPGRFTERSNGDTDAVHTAAGGTTVVPVASSARGQFAPRVAWRDGDLVVLWLEDGIVRDVRDVDLGLIYGIGFPPFKGGLLFWADTVGAKQILQWLQPLEPLGERMKPTKMLLELAASGGKFYG